MKKIINFDSLKPTRIIQYLQGNFDEGLSDYEQNAFEFNEETEEETT